MKIELKNIKYASFASEETACYEASLYIDGKKIGVVSNEGHGGPDSFHADVPIPNNNIRHQEACDWCIANLPKWYIRGETFDTDLEMHCAKLLEDHLLAKDLKAALRKKVLFTMPSEDGIQVVSFKRITKIGEWQIKHVVDKYKPDCVLNSLPFAEALSMYREAV